MPTAYLLFENLLFFAIATSFFALVGWAWRHSKPFYLPEPLPEWFKIWFGTVQVVGLLLPIAALVWGIWQGYSSVLTVLIPYLVMLGLQILSEIVTLRYFHTVVWVMIPYLYLPYRIWQLYEGMTLLSPTDNPLWLKNLLFINIVLWTLNYALNLFQLPRLLHWETQVNNE
ncbi:hypothetical protein H6G17_12160 [Chroococcidiopsis sp. FACHB-1243]|uniref:DUF7733 domain-containing protein n=1 Tax=Chroococcidiopsis sp. [FACHB-1243] TaxID=2692781 RepID=UPI001784378F|nr:hypothetical protein [Chroococcidiopsis sp. [FACHB-1243]]MBD2306266.1 hypothetical protein [Chroococcidiopsis sp. [FACHB-1243]]